MCDSNKRINKYKLKNNAGQGENKMKAKQTRKIIVISLGGSVINPGIINTKFIKELTNELKNQVETKNRSFIIICGGGKVARSYLEETQIELSNGKKDLVGVEATWLNAQLITSYLEEYAPTKPKREFNQFIEDLEFHTIVVGGGFLPGFTTDEDAIICADYVKSSLLINITNIDGIYSKDPKKEPTAQKYKELTYENYIELIQKLHIQPGYSVPFTLIATKLAERSKCRVLIVPGVISDITKALGGINVHTEISDMFDKNI